MVGVIIDERVTVIIGRGVISGSWIWVAVCRFPVVRGVYREAINWGMDGEVMKDDRWRRD